MPAKYDTRWIKTPEVLKRLIDVADGAVPHQWRESLEIRAIELDAEGVIPASWSSDEPVSVPSPRATSTPQVSLDTPARELEQNHEVLDRMLRVLARTLDCDYVTALEKWTNASKSQHELYKNPGEVDTARGVLKHAGVKELDTFGHDLQMTLDRDIFVGRRLEADLMAVKDEPTDADGNVLLEQGFDLPALLHSDEKKERRWRAARALNPAYANREHWEADDLLHLESGVDLLRTLERPAKLAAARKGASDLAIQLDQIIESDHSSTVRVRELDTAISHLTAITAERAAAVSGVKTLDQPTPTRTRAPTFVELTAGEMVEAIVHYEERGKRISLDEAAAVVAGFQLDGAPASIPLVGPSLPNVSTGGGELDRAVAAHQAAHGCASSGYGCALKALTGIDVGGGVAGTLPQ